MNGDWAEQGGVRWWRPGFPGERVEPVDELWTEPHVWTEAPWVAEWYDASFELCGTKFEPLLIPHFVCAHANVVDALCRDCGISMDTL